MVKALPQDFKSSREITSDLVSEPGCANGGEFDRVKAQIEDTLPHCLINKKLRANLKSWNKMLTLTSRVQRLDNRSNLLPTGYEIIAADGSSVSEKTWNSKSD